MNENLAVRCGVGCIQLVYRGMRNGFSGPKSRIVDEEVNQPFEMSNRRLAASAESSVHSEAVLWGRKRLEVLHFMIISYTTNAKMHTAAVTAAAHIS